MATVAHELPVRSPQLVAALLEQIEELRQRVYAASRRTACSPPASGI